MKAVLMTKAGDFNVLRLTEVALPQITTPTEILVELKAAGINPIDTKIRSRGTFYPESFSAILGCDGAGVVVGIGKEVTRFSCGDEVYFCAGGLGKPNTGNYAQYAVIEQDYVAMKPKSLSFPEAACAPLALITAWESLYDRVKLNSEDTVLIHGGAGGVGHVAIQLAKLRGAKIATTVSNSDKEKLVRKLGADYPILYKQQNFVSAIMDLTQGKGVDVGFDTVGGKTFFDTCQAVKVYGDVVTILEPDCSIENLKTARNRNLRISLELMLTPALMNLKEALKHQTKILEQCALWFDARKLTIHLEQTFPLAEASMAHKIIENGSVTGKIALIIS
ncbi:bifunctional protein: zinc-containing alcohol dehydrogenase [Geminocystis sp. NIES-3708]|uniref:zinc-dependent alcohol dehydrogenase family protein n=1 Tax=Geminocystis sp. NIES-3708 TaxID=1615909 RepID=UPI0005FC442D|nr:zinc-dependent alcohol dehydrogenase family protein [Geminocystis sp. NIES-3708]BAQ62202.1 bifunctional protein: zinc-containing alcohol dehydrogenase [Geminocystis sp. NIES-3708]